jgi:hypothetical protein
MAMRIFQHNSAWVTVAASMLLALCCMFHQTGFSQNKIAAWQYWFNNNYAGMQEQPVPPASVLHWQASVPTNGLEEGLHLLHIRFRDDSARYSSTVSRFFYKAPSSETALANLVTRYQYWFNNQNAQGVEVLLSPAPLVQLSAAIPTASLTPGLHLMHMRFGDITGQWSSTSSMYVLVTRPVAGVAEMKLSRLQYWFDNHPEAALTIPVAPDAAAGITRLVDAAALPDGLHQLHLRIADTTGIWSSTLSQFFYKSAISGVTSNVITGYRYWFNNDGADKMVVRQDNALSILELQRDVDLGCLTAGSNYFQMQFRDVRGLWSSALSVAVTVNLPPTNVYRFTGNGNWSEAANWLNNNKPALDLPGCKEIIIDHVPGGVCLMDVPQHLLKNSKLTVLPGKTLVIPEALMIK